MGFYGGFGVQAPFDSDYKLATSYFLSPVVLGCSRLVIGLFQVAVLIAVCAYAGINHQYPGREFSYFTIITYTGLCAYMFASAVQTLAYARTGQEPLRRWKRPFQLAHLLLQTTVLNYPILVTIVFWAILTRYDSPFLTQFSTFSNISVHALNSLFCLLEMLVFSRADSPRWTHLVPLLLFLCGYLGIAYITLASEQWIVYPFLNPSLGGIVAAYVFWNRSWRLHHLRNHQGDRCPAE